MSRYTANNFIVDLQYINRCLADRESTLYGICGLRNNMTLCDSIEVQPDGTLRDYRCLGGGTPREAKAKAHELPFRGDMPKKLTRQQCKSIMRLFGVDFTQDYHSLNSATADLLGRLARKSGYRQPRNANGSTARYFYQHLKTRVKVDFDHFAWNYPGLVRELSQ